MRKNLATLLTSLLAVLAIPAHAVEPAKFDATPLSDKCLTTAATYWHFLEYQAGNMDEAEAVQRYASGKSDPALPRVALQNAYAYKSLDNDFLSDYVEWTCKAGEFNMPILPIARLADAARQCYKQNPDTKNKVHPCFAALRNKALGFPENYVKVE
jgi:hypothetical protein